MQTSRVARAPVALAIALLAAAPSAGAAQKRQRDLITREEILNSAHRDMDLFQVIRSLRPRFLQPPPGIRTLGGAYSPPPVAVYVDGRRETGLDALRTLAAVHAQEVRYLDPARSESEFGPTASGGAITVKLFKGVDPGMARRDSTRPPPSPPLELRSS